MRTVAILAVVLASPVAAWADTWCNSNHPNAVYCDDFDRYCTSPPPEPDACTTDGSWSNSDRDAMRAEWLVGNCGTQFTTNSQDAPRINTSPFGVRYPCTAGSTLGIETVELVDDIQAKFGGQYTTMIGSDGAPLVFTFLTSGGTAGNYHGQYDSGYMELALDTDSAPMDYVLSQNCSTFCPSPNFGPNTQYQVICAQNAPHLFCPPASALTQHAALAFGNMPLLDNNPCHCDIPGDQVPNNGHLAVFDGLKWWTLKENVFPGSGDFVLGVKFNTVTVTIRTNDMDVELRDQTNTVTGFATIPRQYLGGFNKLRGGVGQGCQLTPSLSTYTCDATVNSGNPTCLTLVANNTKTRNLVFDSVALDGGAGETQSGACCQEHGTCVDDVSSADCTNLNGHFNGIGSTCATSVCCNHPFADADGDLDVDLDDFSEFQACYTGNNSGVTGKCTCFDRVAPFNKVDADDLTAFTNCVTNAPNGPSANVPWLQANTPACVSPWP